MQLPISENGNRVEHRFEHVFETDIRHQLQQRRVAGGQQPGGDIHDEAILAFRLGTPTHLTVALDQSYLTTGLLQAKGCGGARSTSADDDRAGFQLSIP